ncbi:MAG: pilus assembly protein, partial [Desulfonatronovibrionaceae bacterium]
YEDRGEEKEKDPYYEENDRGLEAAWCRQSSVVLISDGEWNGNVDPDEYAYRLHTEDLRTSQAMSQEQNADVYSLFTFSDSQQGENSMKTVAAFGNFEEMAGCDSGWPYTFDGYGGDSKYVNYPRSRCTPGGTYDDCCAEWDKGDKDGVPDAYFAASNGQEMAEALTAIFSEIKQGVASGTSITALTAKETTGSLINQAAFYPEKDFGDNNKVLWTGDIFGDWYLNARIDGNAVQNIREDYPKDYDSLHERGNLKLDVGGDNILKYLVEQGSLRIESYTAADNGTILTPNTPDQVYHSIEDVHSLYSCGEKLRDRNATSRDIYSIDEGGNFVQFSPENGADFESLLGTDWTDFPGCLVDSETPQYEDLIRYARGEHISGCRSRASGDGEWKLGDIIYSTPVAVEYDDYSMLYAGGNDGMLHAFRAGYVKNLGGQMQPAQICASRDSCSDGPNQPELGREEWAFIPQDSLPYLRYTASPDYSHIYSVDLKPSLVQTENRKILIGGMRLGGACGNGDINPPSDTEPESVGRSAYYALDVTNPQDPEYLWSFAPKDMGFTYSGPAYVKRKDENGDWSHYIMFASGPTGYDGTSEQKLRIFTVDLTDGPDGYNATYETNIKDAFGGRLLTEGMDVNEDGQTDFVFLGYTNNTDGRYSEMDGGVIKIFTGSADPSEWDYQENFLGSSVGDPVTAPVVFMDCFPDEMDFPYIYFGTGRYFVSDDKTQDTNQDYNYLYGVPFTCNATNEGCATISNINDSSELGCDDDLDKANTNPNSASWKVPLDEAGGAFYRERCYSTPSTTDHDTVFFSTNMPTSEICECGGQSRSWALNWASGWSLQDDECDRFTVEASDFKYLVQLSGGDIKEYGAGAFSEEDGRATPWAPGVSSEESGIPSFSPGSLAGEIIYWREW